MDALGRYLLAQFPKGDSAWVIEIGTNRLIGAISTKWDVDLPAITPEGQLATLVAKDVIMVDPVKLAAKSTITGGGKDFWYFFAWDGFKPRAQGLDQPVTFPSDSFADSTASSTASSTLPAVPAPDTTLRPTATPPAAPTTGFTVSFAALLSEDKAQQMAMTIRVGGNAAHVVSTSTAGSPIYRVVLGPFPTREEADRVGRASKRDYWIYEGSP
jgi:septal ring-binding cell division protein DamX